MDSKATTVEIPKQQKFLGLWPKIKRAPPAYALRHPLPSPSFISKVFFAYLSPLLDVGYSRPLEINDIWTLPPDQSASYLGDAIERHYFSRVPPSQRPRHLRPSSSSSVGSEVTPTLLRDSEPKEDQLELGPEQKKVEEPIESRRRSLRTISEREDKGKVGKLKAGDDSRAEEGGKVYDQSLLWALNQLVFWKFWSAGGLAIIGGALTTCTPLILHQVLNFLQASYSYHQNLTGSAPAPPGIGRGIGLAFGLWAMQQTGSLLNTHYFFRTEVVGYMCRTTLVSIVIRKSLRLSNESHVHHPNGALINHISTDASFFDYAALLAHQVWTQPLMILGGLAILITLIGYSALVGLGVLFLSIPVQAWLFTLLVASRTEQMKVSDKRIRLLQEVLTGIRVIKLFAYERYFGHRISVYRQQELKMLLRNCVTRAIFTSFVYLVPLAASLLSFITYGLSGHELTPAVIFSALQAFQNIQTPLYLLPMAFSTLSDAYIGLGRISKLLLAPEIDNPVPVRRNAPFAISAHGDYSWEAGEKLGEEGKESETKKKEKGVDASKGKPSAEDLPPPFQLKDIHLDILRGAFVVVVGRVGSGKSSLAQALIGEMKSTKGESYLGGSVSYFPQASWVLNASLRDNIIFGDLVPDKERLQAAIKACALEPDLEILEHGLETEIGERGINLSGGQKARVCLARVVYSDADICLLDDPLSAVDAHVSKQLVDCFVSGPLASKTRLLVTHRLEVLPQADIIITMLDGRIAEMGTYADLMSSGGALSKLAEEHSAEDHDQKEDEHIVVREEQELKGEKIEVEAESMPEKPAVALIADEERETGAVSWSTYTRYIAACGGVWKTPLFLAALLLAQASKVGTSILLGYWSEDSIPGWDQGRYMAVYGAIGAAYSLFTFIGTFVIFFSGVQASFILFNGAFAGVMRATVSWHDSTPVGRIVSRLSKDIMVLDDQLPEQWEQLISMVLNVVGTIALVFYSFPPLGSILVPLFLAYCIYAGYYRATSREVKRIESIMRSFVFSGFGEMLSGMASIRAWKAQDRFVEKTETHLDGQNRAYYITICCANWLSVRLEGLGNLLVLAVTLFGVGFRNTASPARLGIVLTYTLALTVDLSYLVSTFAKVEMIMVTAERVMHYNELPSEAPVKSPKDPLADWPSQGALEFDTVVLRYRPDLLPSLKGTSFKVGAGEKIGIVGRTGAGKSSLLQALFRIVEISEGSIQIDGVDLKSIGLDVLRSRLGIVPQDPLLWSGSVRENLDPTTKHTDADLLSALGRCNLIAPDDATSEVKGRLDKFRLDAVVQEEGSNFSAGERQLLSLARVVVRNSRVIILDEATSSVDVETDAAIQNTIRSEFTSQTVLIVAHRLMTICYCDRILVMDAGVVSEMGTVLELFDREGSAFRSMCDKASLSREDILRIRREGPSLSEEGELVASSA